MKSILFAFLTCLVLCGYTMTGASDKKAVGVFVLEPDEENWRKPCVSFLPKREIFGPQAEKLRSSLMQLEKYPKSRKDADMVIKAFPGLQKEDMELPDCIYWKLKQTDFDGQAPTDFVLLLKQRGSSSSYTQTVAVRTGARVVYQELPGRYRGLYNLVGRIKRPGKRKREQGEDRVKHFLKESGISQNPSDLDGDGKTDLLMYIQFDPCDPDDDENPLCGNMGNLAFFPVPYFWNGRNLACDESKSERYYANFLKNLKHLDRSAALVILRRWKNVNKKEK